MFLTPSTLLFVLFLLFGATFSVLIAARTLIAATSGEIISDFQGHFQAILNENDLFNLLYSPFYLAQEFIVVNSEVPVVLLAGLTVMTLMYALKGFVVTFFALHSDYPLFISLVFALCLIVTMPFPRLGADEWFYLGTISPNVFHNATQVLANTLAIPAVFCLTVWARTPTRSWTVAMAASGALASLAKPAITPAWFVVFLGVASYLLLTKRLSFRQSALATGIAIPIPLTLLVGGVTWFGVRPRLSGDGSGWAIAVGATWHQFVDSIILALFRSWAFPLVVIVTCLIFVGINFVLSRLLIGWAVTGVATLAFWMFAEVSQGTLDHSGNLVWGAMAATSALYVMSFLALSQSGIRFVFQLPALGVLVIQAWAGIRYLDQWLITGTFL